MQTHVYIIMVLLTHAEKIYLISISEAATFHTMLNQAASQQAFPLRLPISSHIITSLCAMRPTQAVKDFCAGAHNQVEHLPDLPLKRVEAVLERLAHLH